MSHALNFTGAAGECNVPQPSLTRAIKLLEEELDGDLFRRERNLSRVGHVRRRYTGTDMALASKSTVRRSKGDILLARHSIGCDYG